jgi:glutamate/tyrosine decarboxylase-like PLP-dependent enzyme
MIIILTIQDFVDARIASSPAFRKSMSILRTNLTFLSRLLPQHSVPFYSPRYMAHMVNDVSMPATLGYLMGLMYNPNNISPEAGPLTHIIEYDVGQQLCNMLGYNAQLGAEPPSLEGPTAWGHITCGGSIANMESMWLDSSSYHTEILLTIVPSLMTGLVSMIVLCSSSPYLLAQRET